MNGEEPRGRGLRDEMKVVNEREEARDLRIRNSLPGCTYAKLHIKSQPFHITAVAAGQGSDSPCMTQ